jgi:hypothetical protein
MDANPWLALSFARRRLDAGTHYRSVAGAPAQTDARRLAEQGVFVLVPVLIDRGRSRERRAQRRNQPHRNYPPDGVKSGVTLSGTKFRVRAVVGSCKAKNRRSVPSMARVV